MDVLNQFWLSLKVKKSYHKDTIYIYIYIYIYILQYNALIKSLLSALSIKNS